MHPSTKFAETSTKFAEICSRHDYSRATEARGQGRSDPKIVHNTLHPKMHPHAKFGIPTINNKVGMPKVFMLKLDVI